MKSTARFPFRPRGHRSESRGQTRHSDCWECIDILIVLERRKRDPDGKPEGLAFTAQGREIVGLDTRKPRRNLLLLEPAVAQLRDRGKKRLVRRTVTSLRGRRLNQYHPVSLCIFPALRPSRQLSN